MFNYKQFGESGTPIIILHGFLGSLDNWLSIGKKLGIHHRVFLLDQRNHGRSFHDDEMNYDVLVEDLLFFVEQHNLSNVSLIGHSMGGKTAMLFSIKYPKYIYKLVIVDIAPVEYVGDHGYILDAMLNLQLGIYNNRNDVEIELKKDIHSDAVLQFVLKNLGRNNLNKFYWKCNLPVLVLNYKALMHFPEVGKSFYGLTLFIKGGKSDYINESNMPTIKKYFPNTIIKVVEDADHWVQAEKPVEFLEMVTDFLE